MNPGARLVDYGEINFYCMNELTNELINYKYYY